MNRLESFYASMDLYDFTNEKEVKKAIPLLLWFIAKELIILNGELR